MSAFDHLDARTQLEQAISEGLRSALEKRGFTVVHNGREGGHAPAGLPDIEVSNDQVVFTFEATKSRGAQQDRELNSIRDHLNQVKENNPRKRCYCVFTSPDTSMRMLDGIRDHNQQRASEGRPDLKILPLNFGTLELWVTRLRESEADLYPVTDFLRLFDQYNEFIDDLRIRKLLLQSVFPNDAALMEAVELEETERDQFTLERLIGDLARMENYMRESGVATGPAAIDTLIYLVFLKLYEEKRERNGDTNRLRSVEAFEIYLRDSVDAPTRRSKRGIHRLFNDIQQEGEFLSSGMFTPGDTLVDSVTDDFIMEKVIPTFQEYKFLGTRIDALGAVYEVLALRAAKDVKVGQFFTPENVVRFMVAMAELDYKDMVLDPACGTGRFLIWAMNDMLAKVARSGERNKARISERVRFHQLFGADIDPRIAKIAKMNMWIHGDGKSNIFGGREYNGLTLHRHSFNGHDTFDNAFDVVLTNPPLGELNYQSISFVDSGTGDAPETDLVNLQAKLAWMPVLPRKNLTAERLATVQHRLEVYRRELADLETIIATAEQTDLIQEWLRVRDQTGDREARARKRELKNQEEIGAYERISSTARSKRKTIEQNESQAAELDAKLRSGQIEWEITGNTMKGGAMFVAAIWHYLKGNSYPDAPPEWRGGKMLIILDEGILNTDNYRPVREFLRSHFYIKAVVSLTRDTFVPVSKTSTKTSILYAIKKTDLSAIQKEPIFFGHVESVGLDTKGKVCPNHLDAMLEKYFYFKAKVMPSYVGAEFRKELFLGHDFTGESLLGIDVLFKEDGNYFFKTGAEKQTLWFPVFPVDVGDRMHYLFFHPQYQVLDNLRSRYRTIPLAEACREPIMRGEQPDYEGTGAKSVLKTVDLKNGYIDYDNALRVSDDFFENHPNAQVQKGDILIASTGYVSMGKVDVYEREEPAMVDGHISIVRVKDEYDPYFIAYFLRSHLGQLQFEKWFTGSSGQIELQPADLGKFRVPESLDGGVPLAEQKRIAKLVKQELDLARKLERQAGEKWQEAKDRFEEMIWSSSAGA